MTRPPDNTKHLRELQTIFEGSEVKPEKPPEPEPAPQAAAAPAPAPSKIPLPTRDETTITLKRRLAKELYRAEQDLEENLLIAGKPCDCLDSKHTLGLEATAEELIPQEPENPVYLEILDWIKNNRPKVAREAIASGQFTKEYPQMAAKFKEFRKRVLGTEAITAMIDGEKPLSLEEAKQMAATEAEREVERIWNSEEAKPGP
jgi:hypothetical protein